MIPIGFEEVREGVCQEGDYIVSHSGGYEACAKNLIGTSLPCDYFKCYRLVNTLSDQQIIFDAVEKHNLNVGLCKDLLALVRYVRHIGFNEGFNESKKEKQS